MTTRTETRPHVERGARSAGAYGMRCPQCRQTMAHLRTDEQWTQSKQYFLSWDHCRRCGTVELAG